MAKKSLEIALCAKKPLLLELLMVSTVVHKTLQYPFKWQLLQLSSSFCSLKHLQFGRFAIFLFSSVVFLLDKSVCLCMCTRERERERES